MKKKLFLALLTTLLLLLAASTALAVSSSDYECPVCGEPCTEWYHSISYDRTTQCHLPLCRTCWATVPDVVLPCTPVEGTATCIEADLCSVCGYPDTLNGAPDPNAHDMSSWSIHSSTQHYRYCQNCYAADIYEYEDHYGGTATCTAPALCEGCGSGYGELSNEHVMSKWESTSATEHKKYCTRCWSPETILYEKHYGGTATCTTLAICEGCGSAYGERSDEHPNMSEWLYLDGTQHKRHCLDCGYGDEYEDHYGGTATCTEPAICGGCGEPHIDELGHKWTEWSSNPDGTHTRTCRNDPDHTETAACVWSEWSYLWSGMHERRCTSGCGTVQTEPCSGGTADCSSQAVCESCGGAYGDFNDTHAWGDWSPDGNGFHVRTCGSNSDHTEYDMCDWSKWTLVDDTHHERRCSVCNRQELGEHTGSTATCSEPAICKTCGEGYGEPDPDAHDWREWVSKGNGQHTRTCRNDTSHTESQDCYGGRALCNTPAICEACNGPYGEPDSSGVTGHPAPTIEEKPGTCYDEGYYRIICDAPGCTMPFYEIATPANGQHIYNDWQPTGEGSHIAACHDCSEELTVPCTVFTAELFAACPICGEYEGGVLAVVCAHDDDEALPYGTLVVRSGGIPVDGALCAITVTGSYGGKVVGLIAPVTVSVPMELTSFRVVDMNGADVPFTLADGVLSFETATAGLFLLVPAE